MTTKRPTPPPATTTAAPAEPINSHPIKTTSFDWNQKFKSPTTDFNYTNQVYAFYMFILALGLYYFAQTSTGATQFSIFCLISSAGSFILALYLLTKPNK